MKRKEQYLTILVWMGIIAFCSAFWYLTISTAVRAISHKEVDSLPMANDRIISEPDEPMLIEDEDGKRRLYGAASWYDYDFNEDGTSRLCYIDREDCWTGTHFVAAMRDVPRGTTVRVTNLNSRKSVDVVITDYGPEEAIFPGRIIDLSSCAFSELEYLPVGVMEVMVEW